MKLISFFSLLFLTLNCTHKNSENKILAEVDQKAEDLYRRSQREFKGKSYKKALETFKRYLKRTKININDERRVFWVINKAGYIFLKVQSNPDAAISFFSEFKDDLRLTEAQQVTLLEWISAAKDLKDDMSAWAKVPKDKKILFSEGKKLFYQGLSKKKFDADKRGNIELWAAKRYLSPFITYFDSDPHVVEALIMLGRIQTYLKSDKEYWESNFYLKEAIRRAPGTEAAKEAWKFLNDDIHLGYSGSSGSTLPSSMKRMLTSFKETAYKKLSSTRESSL